jgi:tetratricopeptide (TPR) repeat protein
MSADRTRPDEPERLRDGAAGDPALDELGRWFASVPPAEPLDRAALARVAQRLEGAQRGRRGTWRGAALAFACVALAGGAAATWGVLREPEHRHVNPTVAPVVTASARPSPATRRRATTRELEVAPAPEPSAAPSASTRSFERPPSARAASPEPPASAASELSRESQALERALTALRRDHDPARALALLERYAADFPAGMLRLEADVARVDAHLALGQRAAALAILDRLPLERVGRGLELRVVRAELYAERDCGRAARDFDHVLAASPPASLDERALYGRANCRTRLGDPAGARADLERYLMRYPNGRFATRARELTR